MWLYFIDIHVFVDARALAAAVWVTYRFSHRGTVPSLLLLKVLSTAGYLIFLWPRRKSMIGLSILRWPVIAELAWHGDAVIYGLWTGGRLFVSNLDKWGMIEAARSRLFIVIGSITGHSWTFKSILCRNGFWHWVILALQLGFLLRPSWRLYFFDQGHLILFILLCSLIRTILKHHCKYWAATTLLILISVIVSLCRSLYR
jgi:hypothetical protein